MAASESSTRPIVVVTEGGPHIWAIVNAIIDRVGPVSVVLEAPESKKRLLVGRARRQGWISAIGQLGTMVLTRLGKRFLAGHAARLIAEEKLDTEPRQGQTIVHVPSANGPECLKEIANIKPGVVLLAGCRLLSKDMLAGMPCPVLNYHAGIAPKYRGMNGGYWALASGDAQNFGTTVHLVDAGVDTGGVLKQARGKPKTGDTIASYALRQAAFSRDICVEAVTNALAGKLETIDPALPSKQWYHPTIWSYLWTGLTRRVW
ncbi:formyl transferase [Mesorhizobium australafricanum]|uniref:phosphoribosylglycinamide formyltransferase 1 n=1 Tax=Mesorhizobium australafricanum TaxID=3072311 RepID=A0ABU4WXY0_9HYPH|nr:formyl transferase [Mesorhizobium sp. VK3E]MDX8439820.1 formyl transferase [Mesorhizobium sp. VK3E]